jgi:hypothetical protein
MKILLSNNQKTLGFVMPTEETVTEIGLFDSSLVEAQLAALDSFRVLSDGDEHNKIVRIAYLTNKAGAKCLAMRPEKADGEAWVVLAPRVEVD